jgi:hypothetical protein
VSGQTWRSQSTPNSISKLQTKNIFVMISEPDTNQNTEI